MQNSTAMGIKEIEDESILRHREYVKTLSDEHTSWNYKYFGKYDDVTKFQGLLGKVTKQDWEEYDWRQKNYGVHSDSKTIPILYDAAYSTQRGQESKFYPLFEKELNRLSLVLPAGEIIRAVLVKLPKGGKVKTHWDHGTESFRKHPRIHMAVLTNPFVNFNVGGVDKHMKLGEFWEINNFVKQHGVHNFGDTDRIHLIVDIKLPPQNLL